MGRNEAGFTLIETMVAAAIGVVLIVALVVFIGRMVSATASTDAKVQAATSADHVVERMVAEAASAWATFVPANDVFGNNNADGHEVDFFSEDGSHRTFQWAYNYNAQSKSLARYSFVAGTAPQQDETLGTFDAFSATAVAAAQLGTVDPLFSASSAPSVTYGYDALPGATGGNGFVKISFQANGVNRTELLASSTTPTTFTVVVHYTPSPAPVATATPTPLTVVAGVTATPVPTATPIPCCTPPPTSAPTSAPTVGPTSAPTGGICPTCGVRLVMVGYDVEQTNVPCCNGIRPIAQFAEADYTRDSGTTWTSAGLIDWTTLQDQRSPPPMSVLETYADQWIGLIVGATWQTRPVVVHYPNCTNPAILPSCNITIDANVNMMNEVFAAHINAVPWTPPANPTDYSSYTFSPGAQVFNSVPSDIQLWMEEMWATQSSTTPWIPVTPDPNVTPTPYCDPNYYVC